MSERAKIAAETNEARRENSASKEQYPDLSQSTNSPILHVPFLQRTIGNQAVHRLYKSGVLQPKLRTNQPVIQRSPADDTTTSPSSPSVVTETPAPTTAETATEKATPTSGLIVEDSVTELVPGQMKKGEFLSQLRASVCSTAEDALSGTIWSVMGCPWIDRWIGYYSGRSSQQIERAIQRYASGTAGLTTARDYIPLISARVRSAISVWATTGEVTGMPEGVSTGASVAGAAEVTGGSPSETGSVFLKGRDGTTKQSGNPQEIQSQLGSGSPLDSGLKSRIGSAFGQDFSGVRIHTDAKAAQLSDDLNARAFTIGSDIAFGQGEYKPGTLIGDALIAHELAHTVQQGGGSSSSAPMQKGEVESSSLENDADISAIGAVASLWGGIKGGLSNIARNAMPRLKSGLRLQRCEKKPETKDIPEKKNPTDVYQKKLIEGAKKLKKIGFGRAEGEGVGGRKDPAEKYDKKYWKEVVVKGGEAEERGGVFIIYVDETVLELIPGKRPSEAIDALFAHPEEWKVECAQFVQVVQWYALRHALGAEAFNKSVKGQPFRLKVHHAVGVKKKRLYTRAGPNKKMKYGPIGKEKVAPKDVDYLLAEAPIGSRVMWTNLKAPGSSDFRNENTIKVGPDLFAAHGFGEKKLFNRVELELKFAQAENSNADSAYIKENIFIATIEIYETP